MLLEQKFFDLIEANLVIAAIKDDRGLADCCSCEDIRVVFILYGDICNINRIVEQVKAANKIAMVHVDRVSGLSGEEVAVDFIRYNTCADGIVCTKPPLIKRG